MNTNRFSRRLGLETLEGRQLPSATMLSALPVPSHTANTGVHSPAGDPIVIEHLDLSKGTAPAAHVVRQAAASSEYSAFTIVNNTHFNLTFSVRWYVGQDYFGNGGHWTSWSSYTLHAGYRSTYYIHAVNSSGDLTENGDSADIRFDSSTAPGLQAKEYSLSSTVIFGVPKVGNGTHYQFLPTSSTTLNLYTGG